jgi:hypothetical protein
MTTIDIAANESNKDAPAKNPQQNQQQPGDNQNQQQGGAPDKDKPAQQK